MPNSPPRIVVVDDNPATLYSTSRVLRGAGWDVVEAATGEQALALAADADLVVLDVNLPDIDGFEVCRRLRANEATARLPVIHLSASFVNTVDKVQGLQAGADGYLTHPVEPPVLTATVNAFLRARRAEQEMRENEAKFKAVFENAMNGIALISHELAYLDANPAMCRLLGESRESIVGRNVNEFVPADGASVAGRVAEELQQKGAWRGTLPLQRKGGELVHLEWTISTHSAPDAWLAIVTDITERLQFEQEREELLASERAARAEAERANRLKDDFLATLSHELRTPLNAIVGWSELLKLGRLDDEEAREGIEAIERNAKAQAQMIADLLDVSRITSGKLRLEVQTVDPATTIEAALAAVTPAAEAKGITVTTTLDPHAGPVSGDPARLQQVIWNLVNNAVKFTPKGGQINVTLRRVESSVEIAVADTGQGIDPDLLPHIFERFRQANTATTRSHGGLGLGLAIVRQLVEIHGGTVSTDSPGIGQGATFTIALPVASVRPTLEAPADGAVNAPAGRPRTGMAPLNGIRVMVVDDDADARRLTKRVLAESGAESQEAASVGEAVDAIDNFSPHVLVSDLGMPGQDGFELIRQVRSRGYTFHDLPAVALTAFARTEDRRRALLAGFQVHLAKPVDPSELTAVIATLVGRTGGDGAPALEERG